MSLTDLANLGEFLSSIAVLGSLIYVAVQIRQAERNQRAMISQGRAARSIDLLVQAAHPDLATVMAKAMVAPEDLTLTELFQYRSMMRAASAGWEDAYFQHKQKLMDGSTFEGATNSMRAMFSQAGVQAVWQAWVRADFSADFVAFIDNIIAESTEPPADPYARFQAILAEKMTTK